MEYARDLDESTLAMALWRLGVPVLRPAGEPESVADSPALDPAALALLLLKHPSARVRHSLPLLILVHAGRAADFREACGLLPNPDGETFHLLYTVAVCLQRQFLTRLRLSFPDMPLLEDAYSAARALPSPGELHGRLCLAGIDAITGPLSGNSGMASACARLFDIFLIEVEREHRLAPSPRRT